MITILTSAVLIFLWSVILLDCVNSLDPITIKGKKFYYSNGNEFFLKGDRGITYPQGNNGYIESLQNVAQCQIDAQLVQALGANTIYVPYLNITADHTVCIDAFAKANIYIILGLDSPVSYVVDEASASPQYASTQTWNATKYVDLAKTLDAVHGYHNILGILVSFMAVFIGVDSSTAVAPYVKAIVSDIKTYRDYKGCRKIPIGVVEDYLIDNYENYLACSGSGECQIKSLEFFGVSTSCQQDGRSDTAWSNLTTYDSLNYQWATLNPTGTPLTAYTSLPAVPACPTSVGLQTFNQNSPLPTLGLSALPSSLLQSSSSTTPTSGATHSPASDPSLGTNGKIAIAVTVPLVVVSLAIGFYLFLYRKKISQRRVAVHGEQSFPELSDNPARSELEAIKRRLVPNVRPPGFNVVELGPAAQVVEIGSGTREVHEVATDPR